MGRLNTPMAVVLVLLSCIVAASAYACDSSVCTGPKCHCASGSAPLPLDQMPQFVLFTHDDATGPESVGLIGQTTTGFTNPNGCNIPATFFTMRGQTECPYVQKAWTEGHEIATHTWSHLGMPNPFKGGLGSVSDEITSVRDWLAANCSIPAADIVGFRSPFLVHNPPYRAALQQTGFLYDSSINEHWPMPTSPSGAQRLWPYTLDAGIPQDCAWISGNVCTQTEAYPGLWEVPVWVLQTDTYPNPAYAMDPCTGESGQCETVQFLKNYFNQSYNGNKAPVPIYIHSPWLSKNVPQVRSFIQWVTNNYKDAYFVTMHQLIQWMQNPVPKDKMGEWLGCGVPGGNAAGAVAAAPTLAPVATPAPTTAPAVLPVQPMADGPANVTAAVVVAIPPAVAAAATSGAQQQGLLAVILAMATTMFALLQ